MRAARFVVLILLAWVTIAFWTTHRATFPDCYERMPWNGRTFTATGQWTCLGE